MKVTASTAARFFVNRKRWRNCAYGPEPLCKPEVREDLERQLAGRGVMLCHNSPNLGAQDGRWGHPPAERPAVICRATTSVTRPSSRRAGRSPAPWTATTRSTRDRRSEIVFAKARVSPGFARSH